MIYHKKHYFLVGQQRTYGYEIKHKILWSPKKAKNGSDRYKAMRLIRPGDIIFHGYGKKIHAVSIALTSHEPANRPKGLSKNARNIWNKHGWKIELATCLTTFPLNTKELSKKKYNGFYNAGPYIGNITQGYLKLLNKNSSEYLYNNLEPKVIKKIHEMELKLSKSFKTSILKKDPSPHTVTSNDRSKKNTTHNRKRHRSYNSSLSLKQSKEIYESKSENGSLGEFFLCKYLEKQFGPLNQYSIEGESSIFCQHLYKKYGKIFPNIKPCSKSGNDAFGCDYKVTGPNNKTFYYDAKATNNRELAPFYMSKGEKALWNKSKTSHNQKVYIIYRVSHLYSNIDVNIYRSDQNQNGINDNNKAFKPITMYRVSPNKPKENNK